MGCLTRLGIAEMADLSRSPAPGFPVGIYGDEPAAPSPSHRLGGGGPSGSPSPRR
jgi:hypothetical protein